MLFLEVIGMQIAIGQIGDSRDANAWHPVSRGDKMEIYFQLPASVAPGASFPAAVAVSDLPADLTVRELEILAAIDDLADARFEAFEDGLERSVEGRHGRRC